MTQGTVAFKIEFTGQTCDICKEIGYVFAVINRDEDDECQICKCCIKEKIGVDIEDEMFKGK